MSQCKHSSIQMLYADTMSICSYRYVCTPTCSKCFGGRRCNGHQTWKISCMASKALGVAALWRCTANIELCALESSIATSEGTCSWTDACAVLQMRGMLQAGHALRSLQAKGTSSHNTHEHPWSNEVLAALTNA